MNYFDIPTYIYSFLTIVSSVVVFLGLVFWGLIYYASRDEREAMDRMRAEEIESWNR